MSKAILVIDMPKSCKECRLWLEDYRCSCEVGEFEIVKRPNNCPLKELPQKKVKLKGRGKNHCEYSLLEQLEYRKGFNDCIDEILGEKNESDS